MLLMVEKGISGGICQAIYWYVKANDKYTKIMIKIKIYHMFKYWKVNLYVWMSQKLPVNGFR